MGKACRLSAERKKGDPFSKNYMTRSQAIRKMQVGIREFRRLCIMKGVYPRSPKRKVDQKLKHRTFYLTKDINWLMTDSAVDKMREFHIYTRKMASFLGRKELFRAKKLTVKKPEINIASMVKERYPTFLAALQDMGDPLCHVFLYAMLPPMVSSNTTIEGHTWLPTGLSKRAQRLVTQWKSYVSKTNCLRKAFLTVKGVYFQADICGTPVTWVMPYSFTMDMPKEVDYNVMIAFLEFYVVFLDFVLFRLEHDFKVKAELEDPDRTEDPAVEDFPSAPEDAQKVAAAKEASTLFAGLCFGLSKEVPEDILRFAIESGGGTVVSATGDHTDSSITHSVIDRQTQCHIYMDRDYVQPQWVFDCINARFLLPVEQYGPGKSLPPHLSPFEDADIVDHTGTKYTPERENYISQLRDPTYTAVDDRAEENEDASSGSEDNFAEPDVPKPSDDGVLTDSDMDDSEDENQLTKAEKKAAKAVPVVETPASKSMVASRSGGVIRMVPEEENVAEPKPLTAKQKKGQEKRKKGQEREDLKMKLSVLPSHKRKLYQIVKKSHLRQDSEKSAVEVKAAGLKHGGLKVHPEDSYLIDSANPNKAVVKRKMFLPLRMQHDEKVKKAAEKAKK